MTHDKLLWKPFRTESDLSLPEISLIYNLAKYEPNTDGWKSRKNILKTNRSIPQDSFFKYTAGEVNLRKYLPLLNKKEVVDMFSNTYKDERNREYAVRLYRLTKREAGRVKILDIVYSVDPRMGHKEDYFVEKFEGTEYYKEIQGNLAREVLMRFYKKHAEFLRQQKEFYESLEQKALKKYEKFYNEPQKAIKPYRAGEEFCPRKKDESDNWVQKTDEDFKKEKERELKSLMRFNPKPIKRRITKKEARKKLVRFTS